MTKEQVEKLGLTYVEGMTDDEIANALAEKQASAVAELTRAKDESSKLKGQVDKYSSEIANLKKSQLSDEEKRKAEFEEISKKCADLEKQASISGRKSDYLKLGYPEDLATQIATNEIEGKSSIELHQKFLEQKTATIKAELLKQSGGAQGGGDPNDKGKFTKENFIAGKIAPSELADLEKTNKALYDEITK